MAAAETCDELVRFDELDKDSFGPEKINRFFDCLKIRDIGNVKCIIGPEEYSEYLVTQPNGKTKTYHIFGEKHEEKVGFIPEIQQNRFDTLYISSFLHSLITQYPDNKFDMFIESYLKKKFSVSKKGVPNTSTNINIPLIKNQFGICLNMKNIEDRKLCRRRYKNLRAHNADFRRFIKKDDESGVHPKYLASTYLTKEIKKEEKKKGRDFDKIIDEQFINKTVIYIKDKLLKHRRVEKQLNQIKEKKIATIIKSVILSELNKKEIEVIEFIKKVIKPVGYYDFDNSDIMIALYQYAMDIYAIARIFRDFPDVKNPKNIKLRNYTGNSDSVIYYCGSSHKKVFDLVMKKLIDKEIISGEKKLDIKNQDNEHIKINISQSLMNGTYYTKNIELNPQDKLRQRDSTDKAITGEQRKLIGTKRKIDEDTAAAAAAAADDEATSTDDEATSTDDEDTAAATAAAAYDGARAAAADDGARAAAADDGARAAADDGGNYLVDFVNHCY